MEQADKGTGLTHLDSSGQARMVDVGTKNETVREAVAVGTVRMQASTLEEIRQMTVKKGDVLGVARIAAIMAAKKTPELIPLCHPIPIDNVSVEVEPFGDERVRLTARVRSTSRTGVEMEALTAVCAGALTVYDMCKAIDRGMTIEEVYLERKSGGRSGTYVREG